MVTMGDMDHLDTQEHRVMREGLGYQGCQVVMELLLRMDFKEFKDLQDMMELLVSKALWGLQVKWV